MIRAVWYIEISRVSNGYFVVLTLDKAKDARKQRRIAKSAAEVANLVAVALDEGVDAPEEDEK